MKSWEKLVRRIFQIYFDEKEKFINRMSTSNPIFDPTVSGK